MIVGTNELSWLLAVLTFDPLCRKGLWRPAHILFFFPLGLKGTHIPQLRGLVLGCNAPPTSVTRALIPLATDEEGLFQQPCILSFCGSMGCQDPFALCVRLRYPAEALGPSPFSPYDKIIPFHSLYKQPFLGPVTLLLPGA